MQPQRIEISHTDVAISGARSNAADTGLFVAVVAEDDIFDSALCTLVESMGYRAGVLRVDATAPIVAPATAAENTVILVRSFARLSRIRQAPHLRNAIIVGVGIRADDSRGIDIAHTSQATADLAVFLVDIADRTDYRSQRVRLTERERQILTTYSLGATMPETARRHHIAESTVREHYRRVTQRYADAGRPVNNKAQLLLQLMADGWVRPREILHAAG